MKKKLTVNKAILRPVDIPEEPEETIEVNAKETDVKKEKETDKSDSST